MTSYIYISFIIKNIFLIKSLFPQECNITEERFVELQQKYDKVSCVLIDPLQLNLEQKPNKILEYYLSILYCLSIRLVLMLYIILS